MIKASFFVFAAVALSLGSGCVHREIVAFNDHESKPLTAMQVAIQRSYLFYSTHEHVFYSCAEQGDKLTCKRLCGGSRDVVCPELTQSGYSASTNVR